MDEDLRNLQDEIAVAIPNVEIARVVYMRHSIALEEEHGFTPENTRFAEGGCCDEINEPEYFLMQQYWGERFKFGGLAGYCHGGRSGLRAVCDHVPEVSGRKNLLLVTGPHIGYHNGEWGVVPRSGQQDVSSACGSLCSVFQAGNGTRDEASGDPLDQQQLMIEKIMEPYLRACHEEGSDPNLFDGTRFLMQRIDDDMLTILEDAKQDFDGQISLITGITVNTAFGNFFGPSLTIMLNQK